MASLFEKNIAELKGVGEKRAEQLRKLGVQSVGALLRFYPRAYEDWNETVSIKEAPFGEPAVIRGQIEGAVTERRVAGGKLLTKCRLFDGESSAELTFFNNRFIKNSLIPGETYLFRGKVTGTLLRREMLSPVFMKESAARPIQPVYPLTEGLSSKMLSNYVKNALALLPEEIHDPIPLHLLEQYGLCDLKTAICDIHFPPSRQALMRARERLVFEELLVLQLGLFLMKGRVRLQNRYQIVSYEEEYLKLLPFSPTGAQRRAIKEAHEDMASREPMNRLLQGDVGSGKTAVAAALCYSVAKNGLQSALMVPTEILAQQHYKSLQGILGQQIRIGMLTSSVKGKARTAIVEQLKNGEIDLIVGTHALLTEDVVFKDLALIITDEQHRFGVEQRAHLAAKSERPHTLVMSATPIPRTLALMIYGDLELSVLDELPPGRQPIATYRIDSGKRARALSYLRKHIDEGRQCYIICPLVEEGVSDMASVSEYCDMLKEQAIFDGCTVGMLHGKMKPKEKEEVMQAFSRGEIDILVSTTVVEVGVDVPNAVIILIENAERYGLSQLHQLRGRVGRGKYASTCILLSDAQNPEAERRLSVMCRTQDGFKIADEDLKLRGPGDFFGNRQHGLPQLNIADMHADMDVLRNVQREASLLISRDPELIKPENRGLRSEVKLLFGNVWKNGMN